MEYSCIHLFLLIEMEAISMRARIGGVKCRKPRTRSDKIDPPFLVRSAQSNATYFTWLEMFSRVSLPYCVCTYIVMSKAVDCRSRFYACAVHLSTTSSSQRCFEPRT